tara:strand:- start:104 stop:370 length:267 start_codon:yes stop_codon:yes gene_type:complete
MKDNTGKYITIKRTKPKRVKATDFVHMWEVSSTLDEFIKYSGMNRDTAISRASLYRSKGVHLKKFTGTGERSTLDIDLLNSMTNGGAQ